MVIWPKYFSLPSHCCEELVAHFGLLKLQQEKDYGGCTGQCIVCTEVFPCPARPLHLYTKVHWALASAVCMCCLYNLQVGETAKALHRKHSLYL